MLNRCTTDAFKLGQLLYDVYLFAVVTFLVLAVTRFLYVMGPRGRQVRKILEEAADLSSSANVSALAACLRKLPGRCPERALRDWAMRGMLDPFATALNRSAEGFDSEMSRLSGVASALAFFFGLTVLISVGLLITESYRILAAVSAEKQAAEWLTFELFACVIGSLRAGVWLLTLIYAAHYLLTRSLSRRRESWNRFCRRSSANGSSSERK